MSDAERRIGSIPVPLTGLGCNNFGRRVDERRTRGVVDAALGAGVTLFDTADLYGDGSSETFLGRALGARRDDAVIVTKFGMATPPDGLAGGSAAWVERACEASLARLGTDRIDVYLLHQPDPSTPIEETIGALVKLLAAGKVREIGCSNMSAAQLDEAAAAATDLGARGFVTVQNEYSLLAREPETEVLPACGRLGMSFMPYFPLASGLLSGKYRRGKPAPAGARLSGGGSRLSDERLAAVERLRDYAGARGHTVLELALSWLVTRPEVATVIAGATSPEQVVDNAAATTAWSLSVKELAEVDDLLAT